MLLNPILHIIPQCLNWIEIWWIWRPEDRSEAVHCHRLYRESCCMSASIILLKLEPWMCCHVFCNFRDNMFWVWFLCDCALRLLLKYTKSLAIQTTYTPLKHLAYTTLLSWFHAIRMIKLWRASFPGNIHLCMLARINPSFITPKYSYPLFESPV